MKTIKRILGVLTIVLAAGSLALFFFNFGRVDLADGSQVVRTGTEFAFGAEYKGYEIGKSSDILFCMILTAFSVLFSALSLKFKGSRWAAIGFTVVDAIYMLVIACSHPAKFLDTQGFASVSEVTGLQYVGNTALFIAITLFLTLFSAVAYLLIADKLSVAEAGGQALTIPKKIVKFLRDYKGEIKKIVWPGPRAVVKNTLIVLAMCLIVGAFIWLLDWGLGALVNYVASIGK